jgi:hypothetical protein
MNRCKKDSEAGYGEGAGDDREGGSNISTPAGGVKVKTVSAIPLLTLSFENCSTVRLPISSSSAERVM